MSMRSYRTSSRLGALVVLGVFLLAGLIQAQTITGSITGTVVDSSGAIVPGSKVTVTNEATGAERTLITTENGVFIFTNLVPTTYSVKIEQPGFRPVTRTALTLTSGDRLALGSIQLEVGQTSEAISVTSEVAALNTESADVTATLGTSQISDLVVKGRDFMNLVKLLPGVAQQGGGDVAGGTFGVQSPSVGGIRAVYNNLTLDGARGNDPGGPAFFSTGVAVDALSEIKIVTSAYLAESGPNPGASIKLTTRSGTKDFHGNVYLFKRDKNFNANDFFVNRQGLGAFPYRLTTTGAAVGGPIYIPNKFNADRSKLFFFWNSEITQSFLPAGVTFNAPASVLQYQVPTLLERQGDFSQSLDTNGQLIVIKDPTTGRPFLDNKIPANRINSNGQKLLSVFPLPNTTDRSLTGGLYNYQFKNIQDTPKGSHTLKFDIVPNLKDTISVRLKKWESDTKSWTGIFSYTNFPLTFYDYDFTHDDALVSWTRVINPRIVNEFNISATGSKEDGTPRPGREQTSVFRQTYGITLGQLYPASNPYNLLPQMSFTGIPNPVLFTQDRRAPIQASEEFGEIMDNLSYNRGTHAYKFGVYFHHIWTNEGQRANNFAGNISFNRDANNPGDTNHPYANAILGNYQSYQEASRRNLANAAVYLAEFYLQDQWKTTKRLTLTYGARFSSPTWYHLQGDQVGSALVLPNYNSANTPRQYLPALVNGVRVGQDPVTKATVPAQAIGAFVPGTGDLANGVVTNADVYAGKYPQGWADHPELQFAPRFGFAYDLFGNGETAIRGGFGVGKHVIGAAGAAIEFQGFNQPYVVVSQQFNGNLDTLLSTRGYVFPSQMASFNRHQKVPRVYNWSIGVQHSLPAKFVLDVAYVGNTNRWVESQRDLNTLPPGARFAPENIDPTTNLALPDSLIRPYREYSFLTYLTNDATSNYHALQVQLNRRYTQSFLMGLSYTLSKSYTTEPGAAQREGACAYNPGTVTNANQSTTCFVNPYVPTKQWLGGPQYFDQTHVLVGNYQWTLPRASRLLPNPLVKGALDNWELSGIYTFATGQPMSVTATSSVLGDISGSNILARPDCVAGVDPNSGPKTFAQWFNPAAFAMPAKGTFGTCGPNNFRGPGINNWDMTLIKKIPLGESRSMRLRVEAYNVFNHTQFNAINTAARFDGAGNQINPQFGQAIGARQPRVLQLGASIYF
ncbi:MAG: hypothetical protein DMG16_27145 [Acidobacteria bacterium]|nr:MAG: hypothetical protein DMG16_27145 [Acidobacteriota bacterium]